MSRFSAELHVVLGAGQIGPLLAAQLAASGRRVRMVSRSAPRRAPAAGVEWLSADLSQEAGARQAVAGASVVYHCANPMRYDQWEQLLPPINRSLAAAMSGSGARLVVLDNLYMYGAADGGVIRDATPERPQSKKGALRARLSQAWFEAQARGEFKVSIGRAPDFFGPDSARAAIFHPFFFRQLRRGRVVPVLGDADVPHAHVYMPDVARALFALGTDPHERERAWLLPATWNGSVRALIELFGQAVGRALRPVSVPAWTWHAASLFDPEAAGVPEMLHQWRAPLQVDDRAFREQYAFAPTPIERAVRETIAAHGVRLVGASPGDSSALEQCTSAATR